MLATPLQAAELHIATASNFRSTLEAIGRRFSEQYPHSIILSSASTAVLYNQVVHGAPFDILLAADVQHAQRLEADGQALDGSRLTYAYGKLVLAYKPALAEFASNGPAALLAQPGLDLVIANPRHAPYGIAAMSVLQQQAVIANRRLLRGANVGQAFQMWYSGGADLALVAAAFNPQPHLPIPGDWYTPIEQQAVILSASRNPGTAMEFMSFLASANIQSLIQSQGYGRGVSR
ncbi:MAG: molybdate ABC transporter substrate-binding protein [Halieaceae bacterium]